ncbi:MAG: hypothetical protein SGJ19_06840 [Planctomycetia bacterium]|nr:hypothetical protein [Planctomycetia bacterium]
MAINSGGEIHCKLTHIENGNVTVRRIRQMIVQAPSGVVSALIGNQLPDAISLYSGTPQKGNALEVLLRERPPLSLRAFTIEFLNGTRARDLSFMFVGMFVTAGLSAVYELIARMLGL